MDVSRPQLLRSVWQLLAVFLGTPREEIPHVSIVCGIDFSESSARAAAVAAGISAKLQVTLHLVHALGDFPNEVYAGETASLVTANACRALEQEAEKLRSREADVRVRVELDSPEKALLRVAADEAAKLLVLGAAGRGKEVGRPVGKTADRITQRSQVPTLVIRASEPFHRWISGEMPLRIVVGLDLNLVSEDAWHWAQDLGRVGPVEVIGVHVSWPPGDLSRIGLGGIRNYVESDTEVDRVLRRELEIRFRSSYGGGVQIRICPTMGRPSDHLLWAASREKADLIVVGSHQRSAIGRLWEGSVSRGVVNCAESSVACVPLSPRRGGRRAQEVRTALVPTDFSTVGDSAVEYAYAQVGPGGKVFLVHVLKPPDHRSPFEPSDILTVSTELASAKTSAEEHLRSLIPLRAVINGKSGEVLVLESSNVADAVVQAANRLGADVICLGTHGRSGVSRAVLGSVAQAVVSKAEQPVLLVRPPKE
jgi:nucleotide-binding universal stress UspA family protein